MTSEFWIATNGKEVWAMDHEGDYGDGDTVIAIKPYSKSDIGVSIAQEDHTPTIVRITL